MLTLIIWAVVVAALFYYFIMKPYDYWKDRGVKQKRPAWIFGDNWGTAFRLESFAELTENVYKRFPGTRYSGMYQFFLPTLVLRDPALLKQVTVKDFDHFTDHRTFMPEDADPLWTKNLISLKGQKWRDMRAVLSPSFTSSKMRAMFFLMTECADNFVQHFLKKDEDVVTVEMKDAFSRFTNDVIASTAFGVKVDSLGDPNNEFYLTGKKVTDFTSLWKNFKFLGYFLFPKLYVILDIKLFDEEVSNFFTELVNGTIKTREEQGIVRPDMIHLLMEARKGIPKHEENDIIDTGFATAQESDMGKPKIHKEMTNMDITAQALIFFFAGFESVSNLMCFMCYELAVNPDVQERLRAEILGTLRECGGKVTYEALLKMKYMDMVVSETLRKWPNAAVTDRVCTKPYTIEPLLPEEKPLHLDKGAVLSIPIYGLHRDSEYFPNPERFDPERFNDENKENIKPYTYFPFGLGPRNCIGSRFALLEAKAVFFYILVHFQLVPVEKTPIPLKISKINFNTAPEGEVWIGLKRMKQ